jgi:hypothetical protein
MGMPVRDVIISLEYFSGVQSIPGNASHSWNEYLGMPQGLLLTNGKVFPDRNNFMGCQGCKKKSSERLSGLE